MTVKASGGMGGSSTNGFKGGKGGYIIANFSVSPRQRYFVCVGGSGGMPAAGFYNGGAGGFEQRYNVYGGGGGSSSDVLIGGNCSRIIAAGGGGGAGLFDTGGDGGDITSTGTLPSNAQSASSVSQWPPVGGGGGGYIGGEAGTEANVNVNYYYFQGTTGSGGGSGGTSFTVGSVVSYQIGANDGDGQVTVSFSRSGNPLPPPVPPMLQRMLRYIFYRDFIDPTYQGTSKQSAIWRWH